MNGSRGTLRLKQKPSRQPRVPAWNHQHLLKSLIGKKICATYHDGIDETGILRQADQFTILLESQSGRDLLIFKGALATIHEVAEA